MSNLEKAEAEAQKLMEQSAMTETTSMSKEQQIEEAEKQAAEEAERMYNEE